MILLQLAVYNEDTSTWGDLEWIWKIMLPDPDSLGYEEWENLTLEQQKEQALKLKMLPESYKVTAETYCRNSERTANYELENITNVNAKSKPEFNWSLLRAEFLTNLLTFVKFRHNYKNEYGEVVPEPAPKLKIKFRDLLGDRTVEAYLGATIETTLVEYDGVQYWQDLRLAFPER